MSYEVTCQSFHNAKLENTFFFIFQILNFQRYLKAFNNTNWKMCLCITQVLYFQKYSRKYIAKVCFSHLFPNLQKLKLLKVVKVNLNLSRKLYISFTRLYNFQENRIFLLHTNFDVKTLCNEVEACCMYLSSQKYKRINNNDFRKKMLEIC